MTPATPEARDACRITIMRCNAEDERLRAAEFTLHSTVRTLLHSEPFDWSALSSANARLDWTIKRRVELHTIRRELIDRVNRGLKLPNAAPTVPPL